LPLPPAMFVLSPKPHRPDTVRRTLERSTSPVWEERSGQRILLFSGQVRPSASSLLRLPFLLSARPPQTVLCIGLVVPFIALSGFMANFQALLRQLRLYLAESGKEREVSPFRLWQAQECWRTHGLKTPDFSWFSSGCQWPFGRALVWVCQTSTWVLVFWARQESCRHSGKQCRCRLRRYSAFCRLTGPCLKSSPSALRLAAVGRTKRWRAQSTETLPFWPTYLSLWRTFQTVAQVSYFWFVLRKSKIFLAKFRRKPFSQTTLSLVRVFWIQG